MPPAVFMENGSPLNHINPFLHSLGKGLEIFCMLGGFLIIHIFIC